MSDEQGDALKGVEVKIYDAVKRSATVILSAQIKKTLGTAFSTPQFILVMVAIQTFLTFLRSMPGFVAIWDALRSIVQNVAIQTSVGYITESWSSDLATLNLVAVLASLECFPVASGWVGKDVESFKTSITYIFSEKISDFTKSLGIPALAGACLSACVSPKQWGILGETFALSGVNILSEIAFSAVNAGFSLSLAWPVVLLYFVRELSDKYEYFQAYFDFGLYKISEILYSSLILLPGVSSKNVGFGFGFAFFVAPRDKLWGGLCALVMVYAWSDWLLHDVLSGIVKTDPIFAGLVVVTSIYFLGIVLLKK